MRKRRFIPFLSSLPAAEVLYISNYYLMMELKPISACLPFTLKTASSCPPSSEEQACSPEPHSQHLALTISRPGFPYPSEHLPSTHSSLLAFWYIKLSSSLRERLCPMQSGRCACVVQPAFLCKPTPELVTSHSLHVVDISVVAAAPIGWLCSAFRIHPGWRRSCVHLPP